MKIEDVFVNNKMWIDEKLAIDENYFNNLSKGQSPEILYIGCSDSRVTDITFKSTLLTRLAILR